MNNNGITDIFNIAVRSLLSVTVLFILTRLMGKKQISQLSFFDYVVGISIGSIAAAFAVDNTITYLHGLVALLIYAAFPVIIANITIYSIRGRRLLGGTPTVLIQNGKLVEKNLKKSRFNVNDVLEECRMKGAFSISDVEFAILETGGQVSIQLKSQKQPITLEDLNISTKYKGLSADLIIDGAIMNEHLKLINLDENWLINELKKQNIYSPKQVLLASIDTNGTLHIDMKRHDPRPLDVLE